MVEGGASTTATTPATPIRALDETIAFSDAVRARAKPRRHRHADLVTADHAHTLVFAAIRARQSDPRQGGRLGPRGHGPTRPDALGLPYTTLSYANGPATRAPATGSRRARSASRTCAESRPRAGGPDLAASIPPTRTTSRRRSCRSVRKRMAATTSGVWASGPGAEAVHGSIEQNEIFHLLLQAQPRLREFLCRLGDWRQGVPVRSPSLEALRGADQARPTQAR
jgi:alkaline phosphatase